MIVLFQLNRWLLARMPTVSAFQHINWLSEKRLLLKLLTTAVVAQLATVYCMSTADASDEYLRTKYRGVCSLQINGYEVPCGPDIVNIVERSGNDTADAVVFVYVASNNDKIITALGGASPISFDQGTVYIRYATKNLINSGNEPEVFDASGSCKIIPKSESTQINCTVMVGTDKIAMHYDGQDTRETTPLVP